MFFMKSVHSLTKLRRLIKSLAVSIVFLFLGIIGSSFSTTFADHSDFKKSVRDSSFSDKSAFPSLFLNDPDPLRPGSLKLHPRAQEFVQNYIAENSVKLNRMKVWGKPYFDIYDGILAQFGLPVELKYVSVIESSLKPGALSPAGALGPWQIMPAEARRLGLKVNGSVDERKNFYKSTQAAARFMKELYGQFNDWVLVIAAYNCGPGRLRQAITKSGSRDFWTLQRFLPLETRNHVKKFIGTHYIFEGSGGLTTMTAAEMDQYTLSASLLKSQKSFLEAAPANTITVELSGKFNGNVIVKILGLDMATFNQLNPNFDKRLAKAGTYVLRLPIDMMMKFEKQRRQILEESIGLLLN